MAAPTAAFTVIPLSDVDPDSPITTGLVDSLRLNDQNLFAQLVGDPVSSPTFTAAAEHDHDGVNSKAVNIFPTLNAKEVINTTSRILAASLADLPGTSITYASAELPATRKALIVVSIEVTGSSAAPIDVEFVIVVDGTITSRMQTHLAGAVRFSSVALTDLATLTTGADRIIKLQGRRITGTASATRTHVQTVLVN